MLKSRSSDSFTSQLKDFIRPVGINLTNCGKVIIRKQTLPDENPNSTNFGYTKAFGTDPTTTNTFTLQDDGVQTFNNVLFGSGYTVNESTVPANWALDHVNCSASTGVTPFSYDSSSVTDNGAGDLDADIGEVCVAGLSVGNHTVNETSPPAGYGGASETDLVATVVAGTNCTNNQPTGTAVVTFENAPLADIQVNFRDGGSGETSATSIVCTNTGTTADTDTAAGWDDSVTHEGIEIDPSPRTIVCTIEIDP